MATPSMLPDIPGLAEGDPDAMIEYGLRVRLSLDHGINLGPIVLGLAFDLLLLGVTLHQFMTYLQYPGKERLFNKVIVFWVVIVGTASSAYGLFYVYTLFVKNYGIYRTFIRLDLSGNYGIFNVLITAPVQIFYTERTYRLMKNRIWVLILFGPLILVNMVAGFGLCAIMRSIHDIMGNTDLMKPWYYTLDLVILVIDVLLTGLLIYGLSRAKTGWSDTDQLVTRLIRTSVEAQLPATLYAVGILITYSLIPLSPMNTFWVMQHTKAYTISLLATLNFRSTLRIRGDSGKSGSGEHAPYSTALRRRTNGQTMDEYPMNQSVGRLDRSVIQIEADVVMDDDFDRSVKPSVNRDIFDDAESVHISHVLRKNPDVKVDDWDTGVRFGDATEMR